MTTATHDIAATLQWAATRLQDLVLRVQAHTQPKDLRAALAAEWERDRHVLRERLVQGRARQAEREARAALLAEGRA